MKFEDLKVKPGIVKALNEIGIKEPTTIQEKAIPIIMSGKDMVGMSKTGSGKTAAFGIPILQNLKQNKDLQVLIMAPIRELAVQISKELSKFGKYLDFRVATVYGGVALGPQIQAMAKSQIVVATPGRLLDHLQRGNVDLSKISCFVLDEADKMVEMGFIEDIRRILSQTPDNKQMLLFGATISNEIDRLKRQHMKNPEVAKADAHVKHEFLEQYYYNIPYNEKFSLLMHLLNKEETDQVIIFCSTRNTVELVAKNLKFQGVKAGVIHGKLSQNQRLKVIGSFNNGKPDILVASAVAARGLDIKGVSHIFNYDLAQDPQEYIHRVGRTARAGESGKAITLLSEKDHAAFSDILRSFDVNVQELPKENFAKVRFNASVGISRGRFGNRSGPRRYGQGRSGNRSDNRSDNRSGSRSGSRSGNRFGRRSFGRR